MTLLAVHDSVDFTTLKENLDVSDGNLASHLKTLEKMEFIRIEKSFVGRKPNTSYMATSKGSIAFKEHLAALEKIIKG